MVGAWRTALVETVNDADGAAKTEAVTQSITASSAQLC